MSRGRGFSSRGSSYRGSSNRGNTSWSSNRGYSSGRGGGGGGMGGGGGRFSSSFNNSFDTRSSKYPGPERYGSRSHTDEYRKPYKDGGASNYAGRELHHSHRSSPDRKRMRTESISSRHDSYGGSTDGYTRYDSTGGGYSERRGFSGDNRKTSMSRGRDHFRKLPSMALSSPIGRGSYRGRLSPRGGGGGNRSRLRDRPPISATRRRLVENSYAVRKRVIPRSSDYARRLKISRMRSAIARRTKRDSKLSDKEDSDDDDDDDDDDKVKDDDDDDMDELGEETKEDEKEKPKRSSVAKEKIDGETANDEDKDTEKTTEQKEADKDQKAAVSPKKKDDKEKSEANEKEDHAEVEKSKKSRFIRLVCPHCSTECPTFIKYSMHLQSGRHKSAMHKIALKQKRHLSDMRQAQRAAQRELEKNAEDLAPRTSFCQLCKLNYKQPKPVHQASDTHKSMKRFLMPTCKICKITFKSPMIYESHCCSIEHIKKKQLQQNGDHDEEKDSASGIDDDDNLENFVTIDSIGDMDDDETTDKKKEPEKEGKAVINVGIENIRKVDVHYCDLCRMYLPRADEGEIDKILSKHCKQRTHLQKYIRYKEDRELTRRAERLQRKETAEKERDKVQQQAAEKDKVKVEKMETDKDADKKEEIQTENTTKTEPGVPAAEEEVDEKIWDDVNKDIGDILDDVHSAAKFDDDEDEDDSVANGERYDRFRSGEKQNEDLKTEVISEAAEKSDPPAVADA